MENRASNSSEYRPGKTEILALDIATHTGYYSLHGYGTWNFTESARRNGNKQHKHFRDTLIDYITRHGIRQIVAEDVNVNNHFSDLRKLSEFRGILLEVCDELDLPEPCFVNISTLKKWATGTSRADKGEMIYACHVRYRFSPPDDNVADACHLYHYYLRKYRIF
ncbi:hypothetical protein LJC45_03660 [Alistipes sp. OttesenSCG-928-B03]|nr:hypothetical protein [Alistipes sp. OttesenSCG-928-B03]